MFYVDRELEGHKKLRVKIFKSENLLGLGYRKEIFIMPINVRVKHMEHGDLGGITPSLQNFPMEL